MCFYAMFYDGTPVAFVLNEDQWHCTFWLLSKSNMKLTWTMGIPPPFFALS